MPTLDIISVNLWQILISLCNLLIIFLILKRVLYRPVKKVLAQRQDAVQQQYDDARIAKDKAWDEEKHWNEKMQTAEAEADRIVKDAVHNADLRGQKIVSDAKQKADGMIRAAQAEVVLEHKKAQEDIKQEIVDVSSQIAEKLLEREINSEDHQKLIDSFIDEMGETDVRDK